MVFIWGKKRYGVFADEEDFGVSVGLLEINVIEG